MEILQFIADMSERDQALLTVIILTASFITGLIMELATRLGIYLHNKKK